MKIKSVNVVRRNIDNADPVFVVEWTEMTTRLVSVPIMKNGKPTGDSARTTQNIGEAKEKTFKVLSEARDFETSLKKQLA